MSYILDALKKSEREKTLGQVPTLESVVSDGAKKQRSGTPWWLNVIVFFVALLAVVGILKMAGLLNFTQSMNATSQQSGQVTESATDSNQGQPDTDTVAAVSASPNQTGEDISEGHSEQSLTATQDVQVDDSQLQTEIDMQNQEMQTQDTREPVEQVEGQGELPGDIAVADLEQVNEQAAVTQELEEKFAAQEAEELAALARQQQAEIETQSQPDNSANSNAAAQPTPSDYEEVIHDGLRDISVNVVSYSSDSRQRFVMLDLTIFKEGDQLANNAQVIEIIRTGAIVEYQGKRYLLKP